ILCFSTCFGYEAYKIHDEDSCPFQGIIGPVESVEWADSLLAFQVFYHTTNYRLRLRPLDVAVEVMNKASGLDNVFRLYISPELRKDDTPKKERERELMNHKDIIRLLLSKYNDCQVHQYQVTHWPDEENRSSRDIDAYAEASGAVPLAIEH